MMHQYLMDLTCEPNIYVSCFTSELRNRLVPINMFKPSGIFFADCSDVCFFCGSFLLFVVHVYLCYAVFSVP